MVVWLCVCGCEGPHPDYFGSVRPKHGPDELWLNNGAEPEWIDPGKCSDGNGGEIIRNIFAGLTQAHPKSLESMPDIAERWDVSDDGQSFTFYLRPARWSDGRPLTAHDFEWSWKRVLNPETAAKYASMLYVLKNGAAYNQRAIHLKNIDDQVSKASIQSVLGDDIELSSVELQTDSNTAFVFVSNQEQRQSALDLLSTSRELGSDAIATITDSSVVGVRAFDDARLQVNLDGPVPYFVSLLSFYAFMPVPRHVIEELESNGLNPDLWTRPEHIVSNGAYILEEWRFRQYMLFAKNEHYWNADQVRIQRVKALMVESYNTSLNMYRAGEIDWPGGNTALPSEFLDHLRQYKDFQDAPYLGVYFYWFNTKTPPMDNPLVRQALSLAMHRESMVQNVTRGGQIPTADLVPDGLAGYEGLGSDLFNPTRARELLAEAGYPDGKDLPPITLIYNTSEGHKQIAEAAQQMWKEHLGITVQIENQEWKVYLKNLQLMQFQIARMGWIGDYADPYTFLEILSQYSGNNHSLWKQPEYDRKLTRANRTRDPERRMSILREAEQLAMAEQPILPIYVYTRSVMIKPYLRGYWSNHENRHPWKYMSIDERWYNELPTDLLEEDIPPPLVPKEG